MNDQLSPAQLNALMGKNDLTPDQSATALGHSNNLLSNMIGSTGPKQALPNPLSLIKGAADDALQFAQSAVHVPGDIISGLQGKGPDTSTQPNFSGTGQQTYQAKAVQIASDVFDQKESPIMGTLKNVGGVLGGALNFLGLGIGGKAAAKVAPKVVEGVADATEARSLNVATKRLASTEETMTKAERESAIKQGRMTPRGKYVPSSIEKRAGEIMKGKTYSNPVKTTKAVQGEIATRGQAAETHLEQNVQPITNKEDFNAFQAARASSEKYMTPTEASAYDEQIGVFQKILKSYTGEGGYNTSNYYKALKDYESQVTANLPKGKDALLTPGGSARIQAAKDVRGVVRDMVGSKNPEFKGEMYDLASLYDSLDNVVAKAEQGGHSLAKRYPKTATALGTGATILGGFVGDKALKDTTGIGF